MFYQQNPVLATVFILGFIGIFLLYKLRKGNASSGAYSFFSGKPHNQKNSSENLLNLLMAQQLFNQKQASYINQTPHNSELQLNENQIYIQKVKEEVLELLRK